MDIKINIDGKNYSFDQLSEEQRELYREYFIEMGKLQLCTAGNSPAPTLGNKVFDYILLSVVIGVTGLALIPFFSNVNTTIQLDSVWISVWVITTVTVLGSMTFPFISGNSKVSFEGGPLKKVGIILGASIGFCVLSYIAALSGIPTVLHHLTSKNGEATVTVSHKNDRYSRKKCRPRLIIEEFTSFTNNHICLNKEEYEKIEVGSKISIMGKVSKYGVEPSQMRW